ncbi:MAG: nitrogen regulation protein NR(I) [Rhodobiaceae bacterium]|nr:nitrogen regulation protein NR(I) [Rhodobiaceae bacterium]
MKGLILVADDDTAIRTVLNHALNRAGYDVRLASNAASLWDIINKDKVDVIITDIVMPDENVFNLIPKIKILKPDLPIITMSAKNTLMTAITAAEKGAFEYLPKPFDLNELLNIVNRAISEKTTKKNKNTQLVEQEIIPLVGRSDAMQEIYKTMAKLTQTDLTVMITGESGTGKELIAKALHDFGKRKNGNFVAINMAAIPKDLIESELFGHEKGSFTGAINKSIGKFELAHNGTLFLDEIGDMPLEAQTRLLRVLQQGEIITVGGTKPTKINVRIIAATHRLLSQQIEQGLFREDLYYRLNVVPINIPPLRDRKEDIPLLVKYFMQKDVTEVARQIDINNNALEQLHDYDWPGNVRELENLINRIMALYTNEVITLEIVKAELIKMKAISNTISNKNFNISESVENFLNTFSIDVIEKMPNGIYNEILETFERPLISYILAITNGNQIKSAKLLGINRNTLRKKIKDLSITVYKNTKN